MMSLENFLKEEMKKVQNPEQKNLCEELLLLLQKQQERRSIPPSHLPHLTLYNIHNNGNDMTGPPPILAMEELMQPLMAKYLPQLINAQEIENTKAALKHDPKESFELKLISLWLSYIQEEKVKEYQARLSSRSGIKTTVPQYLTSLGVNEDCINNIMEKLNSRASPFKDAKNIVARMPILMMLGFKEMVAAKPDKAFDLITAFSEEQYSIMPDSDFPQIAQAKLLWRQLLNINEHFIELEEVSKLIARGNNKFDRSVSLGTDQESTIDTLAQSAIQHQHPVHNPEGTLKDFTNTAEPFLCINNIRQCHAVLVIDENKRIVATHNSPSAIQITHFFEDFYPGLTNAINSVGKNYDVVIVESRGGWSDPEKIKVSLNRNNTVKNLKVITYDAPVGGDEGFYFAMNVNTFASVVTLHASKSVPSQVKFNLNEILASPQDTFIISENNNSLTLVPEQPKEKPRV